MYSKRTNKNGTKVKKKNPKYVNEKHKTYDIQSVIMSWKPYNLNVTSVLETSEAFLTNALLMFQA